MQPVHAENPAPARRSARIAIRRARAAEQHANEANSPSKPDAAVNTADREAMADAGRLEKMA